MKRNDGCQPQSNGYVRTNDGVRDMGSKVRGSVAAILVGLLSPAILALSGCGWGGKSIDETQGWSAAKLYQEAKEQSDSGNYTQAIKFFEKLEARYPYGRYAQQAQLDAAYAYYRDGEAASAVAACDRFIKLHPNHANVDYAHYLKGLVNFNDNQGLFGWLTKEDPAERDPKAARDAFDAFKELANRFPESKYTPDAQSRMKFIVNSLATHEVHVARWYMRRGAYVAAANRAQFTVKTYPEAPAMEEALALMAGAYDAMGIADLRDDAVRVLEKNFPKSTFLRAKSGGSQSWARLW